MIARWVPPHVPTLVVSLSSAVTLAVVGCVWATLNGWQPMSLRGVLLVLGSSLLLAAGYQLLMISLRSGAEFSVIGSFRYASVLWAIAIGYALWGDVPNLLAVAGIAVVVGAGLYILHRERRRAGRSADDHSPSITSKARRGRERRSSRRPGDLGAGDVISAVAPFCRPM